MSAGQLTLTVKNYHHCHHHYRDSGALFQNKDNGVHLDEPWGNKNT
jgi:hypothetical protein